MNYSPFMSKILENDSRKNSKMPQKDVEILITYNPDTPKTVIENVKKLAQ